jgi:prolyl-tRNA synthetase
MAVLLPPLRSAPAPKESPMTVALRMTNLHVPTLKEDPTEAEIASHRLLLRAGLIRKAAGLEKGSGVPNKTQDGSMTKAQVRESAETKMPDLNANDVEAAMKIIEGTARQMGITVSA